MPTFEEMFEITRRIGEQGYAQHREKKVQKSIESILDEVSKSSDPFAEQNAMAKILSQVDPERQPLVLQYVQGVQAKKTREREKRALLKAGIDPDLPQDIQKEIVKARAKGAPKSKARELFEKKSAESVVNSLEEAPRVRQQFENLNRMESLSKSLGGAFGYGKAALGSQDASEFNALGVGALEAPIHALFGKGLIAQRKFEALKEAFTPTAGETQRTQLGKIKALRSFNDQAMKTISRMQRLYDEYGIDIPPEEVFKINAEAENLYEQAMQKGAEFQDSPEAEDMGVAGVSTPENPDRFKKKEPLDKTPLEEVRAEAQELPKEEPFEQPTAVAQVGRGVAKALGSTGDFANWLISLAGDFDIDVKKHSKNILGKERANFEELAEAGYDYVTGGAGKPKDMLDRYVETGVKTATEFALPFGGKAKALTAAGEGFLAGTALQTAKEADLGPTAEVISLFLPTLAKNSPSMYQKAMEIAKDPAKLMEMAKDFGSWMKSAPGKAYDYGKEKLIRPSAEIVAKKLGLKEKDIIGKGAEALSVKERQPLSEVFKSEEINAIEAKMSQSPEGSNYYKPLFDEISKEHFDRYESALAKGFNKKAKNFTEPFHGIKEEKELKKEFFEAIFEENEAVKAKNETDFGKLRKLRKKNDRVSVRSTKSIEADVDAAIEGVKKGGVKKGDQALLKELESVKERIAESRKGDPKEINALRDSIKEAEASIAANQKNYRGYAEKIPEVKKAIDEKRKAIELAKEKLEKLNSQGALVSEVEAIYRKHNKTINWAKKLGYKEYANLKSRGAAKNALIAYGKKNPEYLKAFNELNARYSDQKKTILSDMVYDFLHGEDPELVKKWLDTTKGVEEFNKLVSSSGDIFLKDLGDTLKASKVHEMIYPKIFNEKGYVRPKGGVISRREDRLLHSLLGDEGYKNLMKLRGEIASNSEKFQAYLNTSGTAVQASMDVKSALKASGYWDLLKSAVNTLRGDKYSAIKNIGTGSSKIAASKKDKILSMLFTDTAFQKTLVEVVRDSRRSKPNFASLKKMVDILKKNGLAISDILKED